MKQLAPYSFLCTLLIFAAGPALAQSAEQKVNGYTPPPLFGAPPAAQPRPSGVLLVPGKSSNTPETRSAVQPLPPANAEIPGFVKPRVSRSREDEALKLEPYIPKFPPLDPVPLEQTPAGRGLIVDRPSAPKDAPIPAHKPPAPAPVISETPAAAPAPVTPKAPAQPPAAAPVIADKHVPAQKVTSQGVVTGPKTMPSAPTTKVESETVFTPTSAPAKTLLEQHAERQKQAEKAAEPVLQPAITIPAVPPGMAPAAAPAAPALIKDTSKLAMNFTPGIGTLSPDQTLILTSQLLPLLQQNAGSRLQIQSFATPADKSQSSDRRISLSRALAIRDALIDQGIEARRIDVRALGTGPDGKAADRVDLVVSNR